MKNLTILLVFLTNIVLGQTREFNFTVGANMSTYCKSPAIGPLFDVEMVDNTLPLVINFRNGISVDAQHIVFMWALSAGRRFDKDPKDRKYTDMGFMYGYMGYIPRIGYIMPVGTYTTIHLINNLSTRLEFVYNLDALVNEEAQKLGFNISFNYRIKNCKKL